jgi:hypothetical protein
MSASFTSPTLPSGYTYYALIGAVLTDGSKNFIGFNQNNTIWRYKVGSNLSSFPVLSTGNQGTATTTTPTYVTITVRGANSYVPVVAGTVTFIVGQSANGSGYALLGPNGNFNGVTTGTSLNTNQAPYTWGNGANYSWGAIPVDILLESDLIYYATSGDSNNRQFLYCYGFTLNL